MGGVRVMICGLFAILLFYSLSVDVLTRERERVCVTGVLGAGTRNDRFRRDGIMTTSVQTCPISPKPIIIIVKLIVYL